MVYVMLLSHVTFTENAFERNQYAHTALRTLRPGSPLLHEELRERCAHSRTRTRAHTFAHSGRASTVTAV